MGISTVANLLKDKADQSAGRSLISVSADLAVADAVAMMVENGISSVIVMDAGEFIGLITLRELLRGLNAHGGQLMQSPCRVVMKADPPTAQLEDSVDFLRGLMTQLHITHVPVVDKGVLVGILSFHDIARSAIKDVAFENQLLKQYIRNWPE